MNQFAEAVRRAQLEVDHYEAQLRNALADTTNKNPDAAGTPYSIASRHADYVTASNARVTAEATLRAAAAARETATQNVIDQFNDPGAYYAQLVTRRTALQAVADKAVTDASTGGATPSKALTDAAAAAAKALTDARAVLASYETLVADTESPTHDLVNTLVKADGDDGKALLEAISKTWDSATENGAAIDALTADTVDGAEADGPITANTKAIDALTADTDDGAEADGPVTANRKAIAANESEIAGLGSRVTENEADIELLQADTNANTTSIAANAGNIARNAGNIGVNAAGIVDNRGLIGRNAATLAGHGASIERNAGHIARNSARIGANAAAIGVNGGLIADNRHRIGELGADLDMVRAGVAASIALSRMPSVDGGGVSFGAGVFAGEMAYAVGFQVERGFGTFDIGVTSSGGEVGAGVGVGLKVWH